MASKEDSEFPFNTDNYLYSGSTENLSAPTECLKNPPLLVIENELNKVVGLVPASATTTNNVYPSSSMENPSIVQETLTRTPRFDQELVTQNNRFLQEEKYAKYFNVGNNLSIMPSSGFYNGQSQNVCNENYLLGSTNQMMMTPGLQPQHGYVQQSYQQPPLFQSYQQPPLMMRSTVQEVERTNGLANRNPNHSSLSQEEPADTDLLFEQLKRIHEMDKKKRSTRFSNMSIQTPVSENHIPFMHTSNEPPPNLQNSSLLNTTRRTRGRPRKHGIPLPLSLPGTTQPNASLVPTTERPLPSPRIQDKGKGKQHVTSMPSSSSTHYNQYPSTMNMRRGVTRQRDYYDQHENERSSTKIRRVMLPYQETPLGDPSTSTYWQGGNERSSAASHQDERPTKSIMYYAGFGVPSNPHLKFY